MTLSERIKAAREAAGLTQGALAKTLAVDQTLVCRWENGQEPRLETLRRLAAALNTTIDALVGTPPAATNME
jgi:transcriptional regulator with XRE-family HTH domain